MQLASRFSGGNVSFFSFFLSFFLFFIFYPARTCFPIFAFFSFRTRHCYRRPGMMNEYENETSLREKQQCFIILSFQPLEFFTVCWFFSFRFIRTFKVNFWELMNLLEREMRQRERENLLELTINQYRLTLWTFEKFWWLIWPGGKVIPFITTVITLGRRCR